MIANINNRDTIKAVSIDGVAPIQYYDADGNVKGISKNVVDYISDFTGLTDKGTIYSISLLKE